MVRRFVPVGNAATVAQVLAEIPPERLTLVAELFGAAVRSLGASLPALSVVSAADHIHRAVERVRRGERIEYPLRAEVAYLHRQELAVAERFLERLDPPLPAGEASALAMHLFHACTGAAGMEETFAHSALIRRVFDLLSHDARIRTRFRRRCQVRRPSALFLRPGPRRPGARRTRTLGGGDARGAGTRRP